MEESCEVTPSEVGMDPVRVAEASQLIDELHATGKYPALQVCIRRRGKIVLHKAVGQYRAQNDPDGGWKPAGLDTRFLNFSISKSVVSTALHVLLDRDEIHVDDPVYWYIPEFGQHGKRHITIRHVFTHTAGIPMIFWHLSDELICDWDRIIAQICEQDPHHFPGRRASYHILSGGYILAEIIRRVDGRDARTFLGEELLEPLGFETFNFGAPDNQRHRTACVERVDEMPPALMTDLISRFMDVDVVEALGVINRDSVYDSIIPAGNVVGTAEECSRFFQMLLNGGELGGTRVLSEEQVTRATGEQIMARLDWTLFLTPQRYSLGFMLGRKHTPLNIFGKNTERTFGHIGFSRQFGWADPDCDIAGGFLTSGVPVRPGREVFLVRKFQNKIRRACVG